MRDIVRTSNGKHVLVDTAFIDWDGSERWETIVIRCNSYGKPLAHAWVDPLKVEAAYTGAEAKAKHEAIVKELSNTAVPF